MPAVVVQSPKPVQGSILKYRLLKNDLKDYLRSLFPDYGDFKIKVSGHRHLLIG